MKNLIIKDLPITVRELEQKEIAHIAGGMINTERQDPTSTDDGGTWVPEGTVKIFLGGVQIN